MISAMFGLFDLRPVRMATAAAIAVALCAVLAMRVFTEFDALRVKLVKLPVPAADGTVGIDASHDVRTALLNAPVALIAVLNNTLPVEQAFAIAVDDQPVCSVLVAARSSKRLDCVVSIGWVRGPVHSIVITGAGREWSLDFLEIATHHGSSSRLLSFLVLPSVYTEFHRPGWIAVGLTGVGLWILFLIQPTGAWPRRVRIAHQVIVAAGTVLLVAMIVSPWVSPFVLMMPVSSFVEVAAVVLAPQLWRFGTLGVGRLRPLPWGAWLFRPSVGVAGVALVVTFTYSLVVRYSVNEFAGNYSGLIRISEAGFDRSPLLRDRHDVRDSLALLPNEGYDGQFMYFAMFDPLLRHFRDDPHRYREVVDTPPYRFGRVGFPWVVRAVAGDRWQLYPAIMIGFVMLGVAVSAAVIARLAQLAGLSALWGLVVLAMPGFSQSVRVVLPEPLAAALLLLGYLCVVQRRFVWATAVLALSLLIRETGVVWVAALALFLPHAMASVRDRVWLASAVLPLVAWRAYVAVALWADWGWEAISYASHNVSVPLLGVVRLWNVVSAGTYHPAVPELAAAAVWFPLVLVLVAAVGFSLWPRVNRPVGVALGAYGLLALSLTFPNVWSHVGNAQRASYELFVFLALAAVSTPSLSPRSRRVILLCWVASATYVLYGAYDGLNTREAIFPW